MLVFYLATEAITLSLFMQKKLLHDPELRFIFTGHILQTKKNWLKIYFFRNDPNMNYHHLILEAVKCHERDS